jgi:hypothetical protein
LVTGQRHSIVIQKEMEYVLETFFLRVCFNYPLYCTIDDQLDGIKPVVQPGRMLLLDRAMHANDEGMINILNDKWAEARLEKGTKLQKRESFQHLVGEVTSNKLVWGVSFTSYTIKGQR